MTNHVSGVLLNAGKDGSSERLRKCNADLILQFSSNKIRNLQKYQLHSCQKTGLMYRSTLLANITDNIILTWEGNEPGNDVGITQHRTVDCILNGST